MLSRQVLGSAITKAITLAVIAIAGLSTAAVADARFVSFTTLLREGPSIRYRPIDEALSGAQIDVISCTKGWCEIWYGDATGYVAETALTTSDPKAVVLNNPTCFINQQSSYHGSRAYEFCYSGTVPSSR